MVDLTREQLLMRLVALEPAFRAGGVARLSLIGSRARGQARPDSDVDLLVDFEPGRRISALHLVAVSHIVEDALALPSSIMERRALDQRFLEAVLPDEVRVFG
jgi:predicted nucleotidyltransferase